MLRFTRLLNGKLRCPRTPECGAEFSRDELGATTKVIDGPARNYRKAECPGCGVASIVPRR